MVSRFKGTVRRIERGPYLEVKLEDEDLQPTDEDLALLKGMRLPMPNAGLAQVHRSDQPACAAPLQLSV